MVPSNPVRSVLIREPIGHAMGMKASVSDISREVQPFRALLGLKTVVFLRVVERFEVNYYDALPGVC